MAAPTLTDKFFRLDNATLLKLQRRLTNANNQLAMTTAVEAVLSDRRTRFQGLYEAALVQSAAADELHQDALKATSTLLDAVSQAILARHSAHVVARHARASFEDSYAAAQQAVFAADQVARFSQTVAAVRAKNDPYPLPTPLLHEVARALTDAEAAVTATAVALDQASTALEAALESWRTANRTAGELTNRLLKAVTRQTATPETLVSIKQELSNPKSFDEQGLLIAPLKQLQQQLDGKTKLLRDVANQAAVELARASHQRASAQAAQQAAQDALAAARSALIG